MRHIAIVMTLTLSMVSMLGCATWRVNTTSELTAAEYSHAKAKKFSEVKVFLKSAPAAPYQKIGTLRSVGVEDSDPEVLLRAIRKRAAKMGADAIAEVQFGMQSIDGSYQGGMVCPTFIKCTYMEHGSTVSSVPTVSATAIVFTDGVATQDAGSAD